MSTNSQGEVTLLLAELSRDSQDAASDLFVLVYQELRGLAKSYLHQERPGHTLQPTALVHEAYMRMLNGRELEWQDRAIFFALRDRPCDGCWWITRALQRRTNAVALWSECQWKQPQPNRRSGHTRPICFSLMRR